MVTPTGEIVGPTGDIEGIMFNGLKLTQVLHIQAIISPFFRKSHVTSFWIAGIAGLISLATISAIIWIKVRDRSEGNECRSFKFKTTKHYLDEMRRNPNTNLTAANI
jgi:ABC-type Fe3+ transport system permease subunit